ncbi:MAG: protein kinase [Acidobacteriota bacterium]
MGDKGVAGARLLKLGRYEVLSELGKGAMGIVYLAKDPVIGRMVAIKTIRASSMAGDDDSESREFRERFVREAQTAGILSHPHIVTIHDIGEDPETSTSFIAMEYIEGKNLKSLLAERAPFSYDQIAEMIAQVAEAIDYAHRKGIIHRDIKPANIIITTDEKVKITDFGIAKVASSNLTTTGQFLGTPNYMSPEQVSGAPVDGRSDIFSLGVVLYELLTHRKPFVGENLTAISYKIVHEDFTPPAELSSEVPSEFNPIVARAMAKDPWNRYQRGKDFALALYQLRAHLEEQRALQDLGTIVSEAEFMPTLKLANIDQLVLEAAEENRHHTEARSGRSTQVRPPVRHEDATQALRIDDPGVPLPSDPRATPSDETPPVPGAGASRSLSSASSSSPSPGPSLPAPGDALPASSPASPAAAGSGKAESLPGADRSSAAPGASSQSPAAFAASRAPTTPFSLPARRRMSAPKDSSKGRPPSLVQKLQEKAALLKGQDWKQLVRSEVNPAWFWRVVGIAVLVLVAIVGGLLWRRARVSRPTMPVDTALEKETRDRRGSLEEGKKLFADGRYEESLALFRRLLARSPNNAQARQYAQMAENALQGKEAQSRKTAEADKAMQDAVAAFAAGNFDEAKKRADDTLAMDGGRLEAQQLREQASGKIAEADAAARKKLKPTAAPVRRVAIAPAKETHPTTDAAQPTAPPAAVSTSGMLRLLFDSPVSEGHVMVAVNDQILLRKQFSFKHKEGLFKTVRERGTIDESIPVRAGATSVKVWLSGPDIPASVLATATAQIGGGETRTLRLDYANGRLSARVQ